jgi:hypothetical protein
MNEEIKQKREVFKDNSIHNDKIQFYISEYVEYIADSTGDGYKMYKSENGGEFIFDGGVITRTRDPKVIYNDFLHADYMCEAEISGKTENGGEGDE